jgi:hypothetical protein
MASVIEIPLIARPQTFTVSLRGTVYRCRLYWLKPAQCWVLDFADRDGNPLANGVPLVTGTELLTQFRYLEFNIQLLVISDSVRDQVPDFTHLGITGHLYGVY